jgi:hypothetical protein
MVADVTVSTPGWVNADGRGLVDLVGSKILIAVRDIFVFPGGASKKKVLRIWESIKKTPQSHQTPPSASRLEVSA